MSKEIATRRVIQYCNFALLLYTAMLTGHGAPFFTTDYVRITGGATNAEQSGPGAPPGDSDILNL